MTNNSYPSDGTPWHRTRSTTRRWPGRPATSGHDFSWEELLKQTLVDRHTRPAQSRWPPRSPAHAFRCWGQGCHWGAPDSVASSMGRYRLASTEQLARLPKVAAWQNFNSPQIPDVTLVPRKLRHAAWRDWNEHRRGVNGTIGTIGAMRFRGRARSAWGK